jgi:transposase
MSKISIKAAGIDTGKHKLDVALSWRSDTLQVSNDEAGHRQLRRWFRRHKVERVGIEASGGYERGVTRYLRKEGFTVAVLQPLQVRGFATFRLKRAKNDKIDAKLIADCTAALDEPREPTDPRLAAFCEHLTLIEQLEEDIVRYKTRREAFADKHALEVIDLRLKELSALLRSELKAIDAALVSNADLADKLDLIQSIPGIGRRTAIAILVRMPEIGTLSREQAASLAGLAPFDDQSAQREGQRHIQGGRSRLRRSLYAAALPAAFKWNPALVALYRRLVKSDKGHKRALVACARKLIIYANTVVARGTPWIPSTQI